MDTLILSQVLALFISTTVGTERIAGLLTVFFESRGSWPGSYNPSADNQLTTDGEIDDLSNDISHPIPPPVDEAAKMARFIVHYSSWGSLSHISHQPGITGFPLARVYSTSDGPIRASSGVPYFYIPTLDPELGDMFRDPRASLTVSLAQSPYCRAEALDPEDPRCAQVILTGSLIPLKNTTTEWFTARAALFSRHPVMKTWPESHHWVFCKLDIKRILVADYFGKNKYPSVSDYFKANLDI